MIDKTFPNRRAIERGDLMDVSIAAQKLGFPYPVALSRAVWKDCLTWCKNQKDHHKKITPDNHLNDILELALTALRSGAWKGHQMVFSVFHPRTGYNAYQNSFKMVRGTYDGESAIIIMQPKEG